MPIIENLSQLQHCSPDKSQYPAGQCRVILLTDKGWVFPPDTPDTMSVKSTWGYSLNFTATLNVNRRGLTIDFDNGGDDFLLKDIVPVEDKPEPPPVEKFTITWIYNESTGSNPITEYEKGSTCSNVITANKGFELVEVSYKNEWGQSVVITDFTEGNTICTIDIVINDNVTVTVKTQKKVEKLSSFSNIYVVTSDELDSLSKDRFVIGSDGYVNDYGQFIYNLYKTCFIIPPELLPEKQPIQLGNLTATTKASIVNGYVLKYSLGTITTPEKYNNSFDYESVECKLYTPFNNPVNIDVMYIMGQTIEIIYVVDFYSSTATIEIHSTFTNGVVSSSNAKVGIDIPFLTNYKAGNISSQIGELLNNGINKCYLEVSRNTPLNISDNPFGSECYELITLTSGMGYVETSNIILNIPTATPNELNDIKNLFNSGVII